MGFATGGVSFWTVLCVKTALSQEIWTRVDSPRFWDKLCLSVAVSCLDVSITASSSMIMGAKIYLCL